MKGTKRRSTSERVKRLPENFWKIRKQFPDLTIPEIAEKLNVDCSTVYNNLDKIAEYKGLKREDLLSRHQSAKVRKTAVVKSSITNNTIEAGEPEEIQKKIEEITCSVNQLTKDIDSLIKKNESFMEENKI